MFRFKSHFSLLEYIKSQFLIYVINFLVRLFVSFVLVLVL